MALSLENLKLRYNSLLPALAGCSKSRGLKWPLVWAALSLIISSNSWQVLIYSHAGSGIRRRQRAAPLNSIVSGFVLCPLKKAAEKKSVGSSISMLVFFWGCFNRVALEWKIHPDKWVSHLLILPGLQCIAPKLESLKVWNSLPLQAVKYN